MASLDSKALDRMISEMTCKHSGEKCIGLSYCPYSCLGCDIIRYVREARMP